MSDNDNGPIMRILEWNGHSSWTPDAQSGGPAVRVALFLNVSSPVSAVLLLFPSRSSFLVPMLPTARVRQDFHLHNTTLLFLVCHHPSAWYPSCPDPCNVWFASSQSFTIHSRLLSCAVLFRSLRYPAQTEKKGIFFFSPLSIFFGFKKQNKKTL